MSEDPKRWTGKDAAFTIILVLIGVATGLLVALQLRPAAQYEHQVKLFCRGDADAASCKNPDCYRTDYDSVINSLAATGWEYEGPLHNNGVNCTHVVFRRRQ